MRAERGKVLIGRLPTDGDLLGELQALCRLENIRLGVFSVIGALRCAKLGYYDQQAQAYVESVDLKEKFEIAVCTGNVSLKEGEIFVHAHITLGDREGRAFAGHLMPGSVIFAAEYVVQELLGPELERVYDEKTGLNLWDAAC